MLKRIKYVSRFSRMLGAEEIEALAEQCVRNNVKHELTGILMTSGSLFFQVLEGPTAAVDSMFKRIREDPRHTHVIVLAEEPEVHERLFPEWAMKTISLDRSRTDRLEPLHAILETIISQEEMITHLTGVLERAVWAELAYGAAREKEQRA